MSTMIFYKYPLEQDEIWDGSPTGSTYAWGVANPDLFNDMPDDIEIYLDDDTDQWVAVSNGAMIDGPYPSVSELMDSLSTMYGADSYEESEDGYDEAQSELVIASFDRIPVTASDVHRARSEYGVDIDLRTRTAAGTRESITRWRIAMADRSTRYAADAGWAEIGIGIWEYQDGREQAYIMDANDGRLHLYYEGLDYGPYDNEMDAIDAFSAILPGINETIDHALAIDPPFGQLMSTIDSNDVDNEMLDDDYENDFDTDMFSSDDDWGFHDVSDIDDDYDDEDDSRTASVHMASDEDELDDDEFDGEWSYVSDDSPVTHLLDDDIIMYDDESKIPDPDGIRVTRIDGDTIRVDADDDETYRHWLRMYGVDNPADVELSDEDIHKTSDSAHTAGAWRLESDAPLNADQQRMLDDAGVAYSQDETDDGKADITLTGSDKVVADTAEMIGLTDNFVNDAEPVEKTDDHQDDDGNDSGHDNDHGSDDVEKKIQDAVRSDGDDMHEVQDDDQQRIIDGVKDLLDDWKDDISDRSESRTGEAPGADGTDVSEMHVREDWPYVFNSKIVDVTADTDTDYNVDAGYSEVLDDWPELYDANNESLGYADDQKSVEEAWRTMVNDAAERRSRDYWMDIDDALDEIGDLPEMNSVVIRYPSDESDSYIYWVGANGPYICDMDDFSSASYDDAINHLRDHAESAVSRTASTRRAHSLNEISVLDDNGEPASISITMDKDYDTEHADYTFESDRNDIHIDDFWGEIDPEAYDDEREYMWTFGSDTDGQLYGGSAETFEEAEESLYSSAQDYFTLYVPDVLREAREIADDDLHYSD